MGFAALNPSYTLLSLSSRHRERIEAMQHLAET
jgi:hypothetical protein